VHASLLRPEPPKRRGPPPLWLVSNGEHTVGPVNTDLLKRGVWFERIPEDCMVRALTWREWRPLEQIREVRSVLSAREAGELFIPPPSKARAPEIAGRLSRAMDAAEVLSLALQECSAVTGASYGVIHRSFSAWGAPVTTCVRGIGMTSRLGRPLGENDPSIALARLGGVVVAPPDAGRVERAICERFGAPGDLGGVAMIPVARARVLYAVIELGQVGHAFRDGDPLALENVARAAAHVLSAFETAARWSA
jgi:hypothetical protein